MGHYVHLAALLGLCACGQPLVRAESVVQAASAKAEITGLQFQPERKWSETFVRPLADDSHIFLNAPECGGASTSVVPSIGTLAGSEVRSGAWSDICTTVVRGTDDDLEFTHGAIEAGRLAVGSDSKVQVFDTVSPDGALFAATVPAGAVPSSASIAMEDLDGDGMPELLVGTYYEASDPRANRLLLVFDGGGAGSLSEVQAAGSITGPFESVADVGFFVQSLDGADSHSEFLLSGESNEPAYVFDGMPDGAETIAAATAVLTDYAGGVASGDFNGDGVSDVVLANVRGGGGSYMLAGPVVGTRSQEDADWIVTSEPDDLYELGFSAVDAGDQDGDGVDDLLLGAPGDYCGDCEPGYGDPEYSGAAYVFLGPLAGNVHQTAAAVSFHGANAGDQFGFSVQAEDLDEDGVSDLLIASYARDSVYVFTGGY